jgi:hypothetical protein
VAKGVFTEEEERALIAVVLGHAADVGVSWAKVAAEVLDLPSAHGMEAAKGAYRPKRFKLNVGTAVQTFRGSPEDAQRTILAALEAEESGIVRNEPTLIVAMMPSGFKGMNAAVVSVRFQPDPATNTVGLTIRGAAAEGLIKQHAGERAVRGLTSRLA